MCQELCWTLGVHEWTRQTRSLLSRNLGLLGEASPRDVNNQMKSLQTAVNAMKKMNRGVMERGWRRSPFREGLSEKGKQIWDPKQWVMGKTGERESQAEGTASAKAERQRMTWVRIFWEHGFPMLLNPSESRKGPHPGPGCSLSVLTWDWGVSGKRSIGRGWRKGSRGLEV